MAQRPCRATPWLARLSALLALPLMALLLGGPTAAAPTGPAGRIAVVVPPQSPAMDADRPTLREVFLRRRVIDERGEALVPLNLPADDPLRIAFSRSLLGKDPAGWQRYWTQRYFHGVSPPYVVRSEEAMLRFVADTPGAVGYVSDCRADARVRVLTHLPLPPDLPADLAAALRGRCTDTAAP